MKVYARMGVNTICVKSNQNWVNVKYPLTKIFKHDYDFKYVNVYI